MNRFLGAVLNFLFNEWITHIPLHALRRGFVRFFNRKVSRSVTLLMHTKILNFWKVQIAENVVIGQYCLIDCRRFPVKIGANTDIGPYTRIWTLGHDPESSVHKVKGAAVIIEHHVWIASGVTILPGVILEEGAVVASSSVVTKNVPRLTIVGGNPAREIRKRNNALVYELKYKPLMD